MNCQETDALLTVAEAFGEQADRKLAHVAQCATCRSTLAELSVLRSAVAAEELSPSTIDRAAIAMEPLRKARLMEKRKLALLFVIQFLAVSFTLALSIGMIGGLGRSFERGGIFFVGPSEAPVAFLVGLIVAYRTYRTERTRLRALEIS